MSNTENYAIVYTPGPNWVPGKPLREQPLGDHLAHLMREARNGWVTMGGPFRDDSGGLVIVVADTDEVAARIVREDPAVIAGVMTAAIHKWKRFV